MRIDNIRLGFATNSSSTHSVIILKNPNAPVHDDYENDGFGWNFFTLASQNAKRCYLAALIKENLTPQIGEEIAAVVGRAWADVPDEIDEIGYVDHQSEITLPRSWNGRGLDKAFVDDLRDFLDRRDVVVLGGNDNEDHEHPLRQDGDRAASWDALWKESARHEIVARADGAYWTLFDRANGNKIRLTFDPTAAPYQKASAPELVDVKITDFCPYACKFCYQASHPSGAHAATEWITSLAYALQRLGVFEVAIGGGEPTLHPNFERIIETFRQAGVVPNFTTRNLSALRDPKTAPHIASLVGAVAVSIDQSHNNQLREIFDTMRASAFAGKWNIQYVIGTGDDYTLSAIADRCFTEGVPLTLLGYKTTGRGFKFYAPQIQTQTHGWMSIIEKAARDRGWCRVGIDTALAQAAAPELKAAGVDSRFYTVNEGAFSMYVDAVTKRAAPSSYCAESASIPCEPYDIEHAFRSFRV